MRTSTPRTTASAALLGAALLLGPAAAAQADTPVPAGVVLQAGESTADEEVVDETRETADDVGDAANWGWLGLLGLAGLAGLMGRNRRDTHVDRVDHVNRGDHRTTRDTGPLDRDGDGRVRDDAARALDRDRDGRIG